MNLKNVYDEVKNSISKVDFSALWEGFYRFKFAVYNDKEVCYDGKIIPKTDEFLANTSILYNGEYTAIFSVDENEDNDILSSKIIHEMFHAFQYTNKEQRFPDEVEAVIRYEYDKENISAKYLENQFIASLSSKFDEKEYEKLLSIRKSRSVRHKYEFIYESKTEQIEGTANYVELYALKAINPEKFRAKKQRMINNTRNINSLYPVRIISYDIGALLIDIIRTNNLKCDFGFTDKSFSECLIENVDSYYVPPINEDAEKMLDFYRNKTKEKIEKSIKSEPVKAGKLELMGVNVYNATSCKISCSLYITSTYFVMYRDDGGEQIIYGDFVIEYKDGYIIKIFRMAE